MVPEERRTDDRLDDLNKKVDAGFAGVNTDLHELRGELKNESAAIRSELRGEMDARFDKVDAWFDAIDKRFGELGRTLLGSAVAVIVTLIGCCATLVGVAAL
jgi:hypothetical protein